MKKLGKSTITLIAFLCSWTATAQTVYKSVDDQGKVTYSSSPPPEAPEEMVQEVAITPGPSEQEKKEADARARELDGAVRRAEQERQARSSESQNTMSAAERELRIAKEKLQEARIQGDDDWQYLATGGRVLKQSYLDRVGEAERRVQQAEKALRGARTGRR